MEYKKVALSEAVEEMFIGPFGSSLKNECFVDKEQAYCMVYEQKHAIKKTMNVETRYVDERKYKELQRFNVKGGDIIVSCRGTIGETFVVPEDAPLGIMHPSIMKIRLKDGVYDKYYFNCLLKMRLKKHETEANGSGIKMAISATELGKELFPVPSLEEQEQIKQTLLRIETLISTRTEELKLLDELIKARFVELFDGKGYPEITIGELAASKVSSVKKVFAPTDTIKYIDISSIDNKRNVMTGYTEYVLEEAPSRAQQHIKKGDIVVSTVRPNLKNVAITDYEYDNLVASSGFCVLRAEKCLPAYLMAVVCSNDFTDAMTKVVTGANYPAIKDSDVRNYVIPNPPIEVQEQFAAFVEQTDKSKVAVQKALDEAQLLFDSLMQEYFG